MRWSEERSNDLVTQSQAVKTTPACAFVQDAPPPSPMQQFSALNLTLFAIRFAHRSIHHKNTGNVKQIYVNKAAARGAWGEHGLGLPGLAKDMDNNNARNKLREEQERERVREGRAREERARRVREKKILEQKNRRREEKERAREMAVKPNFTFMPPKVRVNEERIDEPVA